MTSTILLSHLQTPNTGTPSIPLSTLQSVLSHHLSNAPSSSTSSTTLTVTQLTATAISSPFFLPRSQAFEYAKLQAFEVAFRHAVHLLRQQRSKRDGADHLNLSLWTGDVIKGMQGGHPMLRLAACGGILLGVEDLKNADVNAKVPIKLSRSSVEFEAVVALAEVLDSTTVHTEWEDEFQHQGQPQRHPGQRPARNTLLLAFILASHSLPLIDSQRLTALPLHTLSRLLTSILVSFFDPPYADPNLKLNTTTISDISHVPSLAKLTSVILSALLDSTHTRTYTRTLTTVSDIFNTFCDLSRAIEQTYPIINPSNQIPKQFLLTAITIFQSVLSSIAYLRPQTIAHHDTSTTPPGLALIALQTLTHLSLVISQYGGITKSFQQLQKAFYLSIDIILVPSNQQDQNGKIKPEEVQIENVEAYVQHLSHFLQSQSPEITTTLPFRAKLSFALSTFEQLVPILSPHCIINHVWSVCYPYLTNLSESNREIYESAHSVVLSILVHDPQQHRQESNSTSVLLDSKKDDEERILWTRFTQRLVPFYAKCLIEDTTLTIPQLSHAYSSVVQCASVLSTHAQTDTIPSTTDSTDAALPWYCVQLILDTIDELSSAPSSESNSVSSSLSPPPLQPPLSTKERLHRLHLMLVSTLPSLPLEMLERCLESVRGVLVGYAKEAIVTVKDEEREKDMERKAELVKTLFELLSSERMGQGEKEVGIKWWYNNLGLLRGVGGEKDKKEQGGMLQSRL